MKKLIYSLGIFLFTLNSLAQTKSKTGQLIVRLELKDKLFTFDSDLDIGYDYDIKKYGDIKKIKAWYKIRNNMIPVTDMEYSIFVTDRPKGGDIILSQLSL